MLTREQVLATLGREMPRLRDRYRITELALFGSYAREQQTPDSDVDIAVTFAEPPPIADFFDLRDDLCQLLGEHVDLVMRSAMKPLIRARAEAEEIAV